METEAGPGRPRGVTMETTPGLGLRSSGSPLSQNPAEPLCQAGAAVAAACWDLRKHSLLIVIGDIGTESQLRAVRAHLEQGEPLSWLCLGHPPSRASPPSAFTSQSVRLHPSSLVCTVHSVNLNHQPLSPLSSMSRVRILPCCQHLASPSFPHTPWRTAISLRRGSSVQRLGPPWSHPLSRNVLGQMS